MLLKMFSLRYLGEVIVQLTDSVASIDTSRYDSRDTGEFSRGIITHDGTFTIRMSGKATGGHVKRNEADCIRYLRREKDKNSKSIKKRIIRNVVPCKTKTTRATTLVSSTVFLDLLR